MIDSIYKNTHYDIKPDFINWMINGYKNASPIDVLKNGETFTNFTFFDSHQWNTIAETSNYLNFYEENKKATEKLIIDAGSKRLKVLVSGRDSEIIIHHLIELGMDFDMYINFYWCSDIDLKKYIKPLEDRYKKKINIFLTEKTKFEQCIKEVTLATGVCEPALAGLAFMLSEIYDDGFIVMGDGDIAKSHKRYNSKINVGRILDHRKTVLSNPNDIIIPYLTDELMMRCWGQSKKLRGQYLFNQSTAEQLLSVLSDSLLHYDNHTGDLNLDKIYNHYYPNLVFTEKTDFLKHPIKGEYKNLLRSLIKSIYPNYSEHNFGVMYLKSNIITGTL